MVTQEILPGMLFQELNRIRHGFVQAKLSDRGLNDLGAPMILFVLKHRGQQGEIGNQRKLSEILRVTPATVAVSLKSLARGGYIEKHADETDARQKRIALTQKGNRAVETCMSVFREVDEKMFRGLTEAETAQLNEFLRRMIQNLREESELTTGCERTKSI